MASERDVGGDSVESRCWVTSEVTGSAEERDVSEDSVESRCWVTLEVTGSVAPAGRKKRRRARNQRGAAVAD
eukprot:3639604-Rhodomonas_salina.1